ASPFDAPTGDRQKLIDYDALRNHRLELVVDQHDPVDLSRDEGVDRQSRDDLRVVVAQLLEDPDLFEGPRETPPSEKITALAADEPEDRRLVASRDPRSGSLDDVGVEAAA